MKILLAVDDSEASDAAVQSIATRPWPPSTCVKVISVVPHFLVPPPPGPAWSAEPVAPPEEQLRTHAAVVVENATERLRAHGFPTETAVLSGDPRHEILREASEWSADLIVVGSHERTGIERWLHRSVAQFVVAHATCSVEVVHEHRSETAGSHAAR